MVTISSIMHWCDDCAHVHMCQTKLTINQFTSMNSASINCNLMLIEDAIATIDLFYTLMNHWSVVYSNDDTIRLFYVHLHILLSWFSFSINIYINYYNIKLIIAYVYQWHCDRFQYWWLELILFVLDVFNNDIFICYIIRNDNVPGISTD